MNGRFAGRGVIVTGGGRGIGQATARAFAAEGADVLVLGRTVADLEDTVAQITADGGQAWLLPCDVTSEAQVEETVTRAASRWDRIDVLINNAGIDDDTPFLDIDRARWRAVVDTNLTGVFLMSQAVGREMAKTGGGVILHTASIDASGGDGPYAAYNASKAGLLGLSRTMALELARARDPFQLRQPRFHAHRHDREGGGACHWRSREAFFTTGSDSCESETRSWLSAKE